MPSLTTTIFCSIHFRYLLWSHMLALYRKFFSLYLVECIGKMKQLLLRVSRFFMVINFVCEFHLKVQSCCTDRPFSFLVKLLFVTLKLSHFKVLCGPCLTAQLTTWVSWEDQKIELIPEKAKSKHLLLSSVCRVPRDVSKWSWLSLRKEGKLPQLIASTKGYTYCFIWENNCLTSSFSQMEDKVRG